MIVQSEGSPGSTAGTSVSISSQAPLALHPRSPPPLLQPPHATRQPTNDGRPPLQVLVCYMLDQTVQSDSERCKVAVLLKLIAPVC